jgi:hypothetical protein
MKNNNYNNTKSRTKTRINTKSGLRRTTGQQLVELAGALVILLFWFTIPLLNLGMIPIRWALSYSILESDLKMLARCEKFSQALSLYSDSRTADTTIKTLGGVTISDSRLFLTLHSKQRGVLEVEEPGKIPSIWLNDNTEFSLTRLTTAKISPLITANPLGLAIAGINAPLAIKIESSTQWENIAKDPITSMYFVNE